MCVCSKTAYFFVLCDDCRREEIFIPTSLYAYIPFSAHVHTHTSDICTSINKHEENWPVTGDQTGDPSDHRLNSSADRKGFFVFSSSSVRFRAHYTLRDGPG